MKLPFRNGYKISQYFGENPQIYRKWNLKGHNGADFACPNGTSVYASITGKVTKVANDEEGYGKCVKCENEQYGSLVAHLGQWEVSKGDEVKEGETCLGLSDDTGFSTGPHLHWGVFTKPRDCNNGFNGYIDPLPLLEQAGGGEDDVSLKDEVARLEEEVSRLKDLLTEKDNQHQHTTRERDEARGERDEARKQLEQCKDEVKRISDSLVENQRKILDLQDEIDRRNKENKDFGVQALEAEKKWKDEVARSKELETTIEELKAKLNASQNATQEVEKEVITGGHGILWRWLDSLISRLGRSR
jgi:hypothetical protein